MNKEKAPNANCVSRLSAGWGGEIRQGKPCLCYANILFYVRAPLPAATVAHGQL